MTFWHYLWAGLRHYWRWHLGLAAGAAVAATVIVGSLIIGDSVKESLKSQARNRLGKMQSVTIAGEGFLTQQLVERVRIKLGADMTISAALYFTGTVSDPQSQRRANQVNIWGVDEKFWELAPQPTNSPGGWAMNRALADALALPQGGDLVVRFEKPSLISRDAPLSGKSDQSVAIAQPVTCILDDASFGAVSLRADARPPLNLFVPLALLQSESGQKEMVNVVMGSGGGDSLAARIHQAMEEESTLADLGLDLKSVDAGAAWQISTKRIFLEPGIVEKIQASEPASKNVLTYLVNEIRAENGNYAPYSFAAAVAPGCVGMPEFPEGSVVINQWLADQLKVSAGGKLKASYYTVNRARALEEGSAELTIHAVLPMDHPVMKADWTPDFPGITESTDCKNWNPGFDIKTEGYIRPQDEDYWDTYKGTPKMFLTLADGVRLWKNRFGDATAIRIDSAGRDAPAMAAGLLKALTLTDAGVNTRDPRLLARASVENALDYGSLFLSMSFFLIVTAMLLVALLFLLGAESRAGQIGLLRAVGLGPEKARLAILGESLLAAVVGAVVGAALGIGYAQWTFSKLEGEWAGAVAGMKFVREFDFKSIANGAFSAVTAALLAVWLVSGRIMRSQPRDLLAGAFTQRVRRKKIPRFGFLFWIAIVLLFCGIGAVGSVGKVPRDLAPTAFFGAAFLILIAGILFLAGWFRGLALESRGQGLSSTVALSLRNLVRRRGRSLAVAALLASGVFLVISTNAFHKDALKDGPSPATGGFALIGESSLPIYEDLKSLDASKGYGLEETILRSATIVPLRVKAGEEASCLNLNNAQIPTVLGVSPAEMAEKSTFAFYGGGGADAWNALDRELSGGEIPALADAESAQWSMKKKIGDVVLVPNAKGAALKLKLVGFLRGSILQGSVIVSEKNFQEMFPEAAGYARFLIRADPDKLDELSTHLTARLRSRGLAVSSAPQRLAELQGVQNGYLGIFTALGGFGLLLATAGLGLLVARNVLERRAELGVMQAAGFTKSHLQRLVVGEYAPLFLIAFGLGVGAAILAVWPQLAEGGGGLPIRLLAFLLTGIAIGGVFFCWFAAKLALAKPLTDSIRHE